MVFINNQRIIDAINSNIEYINAHRGVFSKEIPLYHAENGIDEKYLKKLHDLVITVNPKELENGNAEELVKELNRIISFFADKDFIFTDMPMEHTLNVVIQGLPEKENNTDLVAFNNLSDKFKGISFVFDDTSLTSENIDELANMERLSYLSIVGTNITDNVRTNLKKLGKENNIVISSEDEEINQFMQKVYKLRRDTIDIFDYDESYVSSEKKDITISISENIFLDFDKFKEIFESIKNNSNIKYEISIGVYDKIKELLKDDSKIQLIIKNASELSGEIIKQDDRIKTVSIIDGENTESYQRAPYTRDEYIAIREKIDEILDGISLENVSGKDSQKKLFYQIYKRLAEKIEYDYLAIKEKKYDERVQTTCRNMIGGLLEGKAVCAGYADILRNVCACAGIESRYISSDKIIPIVGHAWNCVKLDGEWFNADLTWDRDKLVSKTFPLDYFLRSDMFFDFGHMEYMRTYKNLFTPFCKRDLTIGEQKAIRDGRDIAESDKDGVIGILSSAEDNLSSFVDYMVNSGVVNGGIIEKVGNKMNSFIGRLKQMIRRGYGEKQDSNEFGR